MNTLDFHYDADADVINICGVKYSADLFRNLGFGPTNRWMKIENRQDGVLILTSAAPDCDIVPSLPELNDALDKGWMLTLRKRNTYKTPEEKEFIATVHTGGLGNDDSRHSASLIGIAVVIRQLEDYMRSQSAVKRLAK